MSLGVYDKICLGNTDIIGAHDYIRVKSTPYGDGNNFNIPITKYQFAILNGNIPAIDQINANEGISNYIYKYKIQGTQPSSYKEPLDIENDNTLPFSTHFDPTMSTSSLGLLTFFHAPVSSREEANLKQALLDYAEHNVTLAQQAARNSNDPELLRQHQNAIDKLSYIHREIIAGAPYEIIVVNAYGVSAEETTSTLFEIPPMPYRFEGHGRYSSFEAPVKNKSDGDAKQKLFDDIYYHQEAFFQQQVLMYRYEIRAMEQDKRLIGRKNRAQLLEKYRFELAEAEANLLRAQQRIERLLNQIKQGTAIKEIH